MRTASRLGLACLVLALVVVPIPSWSQTGGGVEDPGPPRPKAPPKVVSAAAARAWIRLQQPVAMRFGSETPLADVLKYIRTATVEKDLPSGLPVYVDPEALKGQEKSPATMVTLDLEGVPLATSLGLLSRQLGLAFGVQKDGIVVIGSRSPDQPEVGAEPLTEPQARTWLRLQQAVSVPFEADTPFKDVLPFLRDSTKARDKDKDKDGDPGVPVYVDPVGLERSGAGDDAHVRLKLDGVPLSTALALMLDQLDLTYRVQQDGIVVITSSEIARAMDHPRTVTPGMGGFGLMGGMGGMGGMMGAGMMGGQPVQGGTPGGQR